MKRILDFAHKTQLAVLGLAALLPLAVQAGPSSVGIADASVQQPAAGTTPLDFTLTRTGDTGYPVVVPYATVDDSAVAGTDYTAASGSVTIPAGATSTTVSVPVLAGTNTIDKSFFLNLASATAIGPTPAFAPAAAPAAGYGPYSVAEADFNGDGLPDLAVANNNGSTVSILFNSTAPGASSASYTLAASPATGFSPRGVAVIDFNGDGKPDLVTANGGVDTVSILLNSTAPGATTASFTLAGSPAVGYSPTSVAVADFNGDGKPDLAVTNNGADTVSILLNSTAPGASSASFTLVDSPAVGVQPVYVAAGDFNGDGLPDLAVVNAGNSLSILFNSTAPGATSASFTLAASPVVGNGPRSVAVGDFNGDGLPDLATANRNANTVSILLNNTAPGATSASFALAASPAVGSLPVSVVAGDFNGDGKPDLAVANAISNTVSILLNGAAPGATGASFTLAASPAVGTLPIAVAMTDFNGDGKPDLATANNTPGTVSILLNTTPASTATSSFALAANPQTNGRASAVGVADFNGDGKPDLAVANSLENTVSILFNSTAPGAASASFTLAASPGAGSGAASVAVGDFNGDGKSDLATANSTSDNVSILLNGTAPGASSASFTDVSVKVGNNVAPVSVAVGDFNGDGKPDLATANYDGSTVSILRNNTAPGAPSASFSLVASPAAGALPDSIAVADFNGDGKPDLAVANQNSDTVSILRNNTATGAASASFTLAASVAVEGSSILNWVAVGDFNGDGRPDLAVANAQYLSVSILFNTTLPGAAIPSFALDATPTVASGLPLSVAVGDFNGDGRTDLATANYGNPASIFLNGTAPGATSANFTLAASPTAGGPTSLPQAITVGDFNGDGAPDLAMATADTDPNTSGTAAILLNTRLQASLSNTFAVGTITARDTRPDKYRFIDISNVPLNSVQTSNTVTITGINALTPISISGGLYSIGCVEGGFTASAGTIAPGQSVCVRVTASAQNSVETRGRLMIGGVGGGFSATTLAGDSTPDPFQFIDLSDVPLNTQVTSNSVTMTGLTAPAPILISKGSYSIGCAKRGFTSAPGTIAPGQTVCVRYHTSSKYSDTNNTVLTIGGVSDSFTTTTIAAPGP